MVLVAPGVEHGELVSTAETLLSDLASVKRYEEHPNKQCINRTQEQSLIFLALYQSV